MLERLILGRNLITLLRSFYDNPSQNFVLSKVTTWLPLAFRITPSLTPLKILLGFWRYNSDISLNALTICQGVVGLNKIAVYKV